jgi:hypothetical protein
VKIWIDLENTPHAMVFKPIVRRLMEEGHEVFITAKDVGQTLGLLQIFGMEYIVVGGGVASGTIRKIGAVLSRAARLAHLVYRNHFDVSVSHGSRSHIAASALARIPCITSYDYEYSSKFMVHQLSDLVLVPACLEASPYFVNRGIPSNVRFYPGLKEEIYLCQFVPSETLAPQLSFSSETIVAVIRPPGTTGHYHDPLAERLFDQVMEKVLCSTQRVVAIVIPRTVQQQHELIRRFAGFSGRVVIPEKALNGLDLMWHADLVVSAGGTMNREAALMGIPTYSILTAPLGAADRLLTTSGRMKHVNTESKISEIAFEKRDPIKFTTPTTRVLDFFVDIIEHYQ